MTPLTTSNVCINVKWQNFQVHLASEMSKLLQMESMVDVTLKTDDGESFQAHRIVLSACSPFFQKILSPFEHDFHPIIISLPDVSASDIKSILEFIYIGEIRLENVNITSVLKTAEDLKIEALIDVKKYLIQSPIISTENNELDITVKTVPSQIPNNFKGLEARNAELLKQPNVSLPDYLNSDEARPKEQDTKFLKQPSIPLKNSSRIETETRNNFQKLNQFKLLHQSNLPLQNSLYTDEKSDIQRSYHIKSNVPIQNSLKLGIEAKNYEQKTNQIKSLNQSNVPVKNSLRIGNDQQKPIQFKFINPSNVPVQKKIRIGTESKNDQQNPIQIKLMNQSSMPIQSYLKIATETENDIQNTSQIKLIHQSSVPLQNKSRISTETKNDLQISNQITMLPQSSLSLQNSLCIETNPGINFKKSDQPNVPFHPQIKPNLSNNALTPIISESLLESHSPSKVHLKKPIALLESTSKSNAILSSSSFSSIDSSSWPFSKSIDCSDATSISFESMMSKPLVEIQEPGSLAIDEKFNHKIGSHFLAFGGFNAALKSESMLKDEIYDDGDPRKPALLNESNTEVHVLQYEDLEGEILKDDEPLSPWLILKPPKNEEKESIKENIETCENNSQICIVRPDDFFIQPVGDSTPISNAQQLIPTSISTAATSTPTTPSKVTRTIMSKNKLLHQAVEDVNLQKKSLAESASSYNIPVSTLYYRAKSTGVDYNNYLINQIANNSANMKDAVTLVKEGATLQEACLTFGVSKTGLWRRVQKELGPKSLTLRSQMKSRYSQIALRKAHLDLRNGVNPSHISKKYNIPPATLHRIQNKLIDLGMLNKVKNHVPRYNKDYTKQERLLKAVRAVQEESLSTTEACEHFKIPKATLWRKMKYLDKLMETDIEELNLDSLDMEGQEEEEGDGYQDQGEEQEFLSFSHDETSNGEDELMLDEDSQDGENFVVEEDSGSPVDHPTQEENETTSEKGTTCTPDESYIFKTEFDDEKPSTSYYICSNDMCLKI